MSVSEWCLLQTITPKSWEWPLLGEILFNSLQDHQCNEQSQSPGWWTPRWWVLAWAIQLLPGGLVALVTLTARGLVTEMFVLSTRSTELPQRSHYPHHSLTGAISKNTTCGGCGGCGSAVNYTHWLTDRTQLEETVKKLNSRRPSGYFRVKSGFWQPSEEKQKEVHETTNKELAAQTQVRLSLPSRLSISFLDRWKENFIVCSR